MKRTGIGFLIGTMAAFGATAGHAAQTRPAPRCVPTDQAEALFVAILPGVIEAAGRKCANVLPASATLRQTGSPAMQRYRAAATEAGPRAMGALRILAGPAAGAISDPAIAIPMMQPIIAETVTAGIQSRDCKIIDRLVANLAPLPANNAAAVVVAVVQLSRQETKLPICAA